MTGRFQQLPDGLPAQGPPAELHGADHASRRLLERLLDSDPGDDASAVAGLRAEYDRQAAEWESWIRQQVDYTRPLEDLLLRRPDLAGLHDDVLEVGVGTSSVVADRGLPRRRLIALDVAWQMLVRLDRQIPRVQADVRALPIRDAGVDVVVGLNAVPCWAEFRRVLRPGGRLVWLSSFGDQTPIVVPPEQVAQALPEATVLWARAGHGFWVVAEEIACHG